MAHFAFLAPPYPGHLNPMQALAEELCRRGHRATFVAQADAQALLQVPGIGFVAVGRDSHPPGSLDAMTRRLGATTGLFGIWGVISDIIRTTSMLCRDAPAALRSLGVTALVCDQTEAAGGLIARAMGLPQISVANALLVNRDPRLPPPFTDWPFDGSDWGLKRNRGGYRVADLLMRPLSIRIARLARAWSIDRIETLEDCLSPLLQISQTMPGFDFPRERSVAALVEVGPLRRDEAVSLSDLQPRIEAKAVSGRPRIFCSLGTLQGGRFAIFRSVAEACLALDLDLVLAHGGKLSAAQEAALPGTPQVAAFVPQREVMRSAAAVVTHGGLNTVLDALAAGLPLVVLPIAFEQGAIASRVTHAGAGLALRRRGLDGVALQTALARVLAETAFRTEAARLREAARQAGGVRRAGDLIEAVLKP